MPVLTNIAAIGAPGESIAALRPAGAASQAGAPAPKAPAAAAAGAPPAGAGPGRVRVSPRARRLAAERGVDPAALAGSGPGGRVIVRDVLAAAAPPVAAAPATAPAAAGAATAVPVRGVRKLIAERMLASLQTTAQLTLNASADARRLLALRRRLKESPAELGVNAVTINDLVLFAVTRVLPRHPECNALYSGGVITRHASIGLGFAVDTERGLMVPVIRGAEGHSLRSLSDRARGLADACLKASVSPDDLAGGTFTVTNLGSLGVESFTPVLNAPQVAILGVGSITLRPVRDNRGEIEFVDSLGLSLTIDHQVVDGAPAARFLQALARAIAEIDLQLAL